jgi:UDP-GlcNAc:undecaprenyl-phosphate GlcNAc-1-phosphate transferase
VGILLYQGGLRAEYMVWPTGEVEIGTASLFITVGWVVVVTNAINLIDGLDGLAGGVSLIACATLILIGVLREVGWGLVLLISMAGFLIPFLYYNRYPAKIFLGDSGSLQIGYYFAAFSLLVNFKSLAASALFIPLLALGVPLIETMTSFSRRLATGRNVMTADRRHIFHYLALAGLSRRGVVLVFYSLGIVFGLFALAMLYWSKLLVLGILLGFMIAIMLAFYMMVTRLPARLRSSRRSSEQKKSEGDLGA